VVEIWLEEAGSTTILEPGPNVYEPADPSIPEGRESSTAVPPRGLDQCAKFDRHHTACSASVIRRALEPAQRPYIEQHHRCFPSRSPHRSGIEKSPAACTVNDTDCAATPAGPEQVKT